MRKVYSWKPWITSVLLPLILRCLLNSELNLISCQLHLLRDKLPGSYHNCGSEIYCPRPCPVRNLSVTVPFTIQKIKSLHCPDQQFFPVSGRFFSEFWVQVKAIIRIIENVINLIMIYFCCFKLIMFLYLFYEWVNNNEYW